MVRQIFLNIAVKDLKKTIAFFTKLGFTFNPQFTDDNATCMIVSKDIFVMLLVEKFFQGFIPERQLCDTATSTEALIGLTAHSKEEVDATIHKVLQAGGTEYRSVQDHGWMYARAFKDIDGHIWEIFYMDESKMPPEMKKKGA